MLNKRMPVSDRSKDYLRALPTLQRSKVGHVSDQGLNLTEDNENKHREPIDNIILLLCENDVASQEVGVTVSGMQAWRR